MTFATGAAEWTGQVSISTLDYEDGRLRTTGANLDQDSRDRSTVSQSLGVSFPLEGGTWSLSLEHDATDYDLQPPAVAQNRDSETWTASGGVSFDLSAAVTGSAKVGVTRREMEASTFKDLSTLYVEIDLDWTVSPQTSLDLSVDRSIQETVLFGAPGSYSTVVSASLNHSFGNRFGLQLSAQQEWDDYEGVDRSVGTLTLTAGITANLTDTVQAVVSYSSSEQDSNGLQRGTGFDVGYLSASLGWTF
jgi:hypothetical protein